MERWKKPPPPRARRGYSCDHPSFSSTLLDAIYRSIDEPEGAGAAAKPPPPPAAAWRSATVRERDAAPRRPQQQPQPPQQQRRCGAWPTYSTSSSSECSSYGGFSSSEAESSAPGSARLKPILPEKKKSSSIRSRIREFRRSSKAPASPGARLASFLNSIFAAAAGNPRKPSKRPASAAAASCGESASACSTASSYSRSCLTKTPSTRGGLPPAAPPPPPPKRSVRFGPVSVIVDEELRPYEKKLPYDGDPLPMARKRAEEMALGFHREEEEEEEEGESDSSSDLFELESLTVTGDELPVYETTSFLTNRAIAHGLIV
ncbi:protein BIG GRAIN 1-like [Ananas comosus]|uniref:Protein BIG GRAIN 1-like n=1 Tax=Ananas comosus TaxID=4615 RepID=A0A6P5G5T2_ANACO|nr:protein BIG GRAIN 1-like [Ananas comosus]